MEQSPARILERNRCVSPNQICVEGSLQLINCFSRYFEPLGPQNVFAWLMGIENRRVLRLDPGHRDAAFRYGSVGVRSRRHLQCTAMLFIVCINSRFLQKYRLQPFRINHDQERYISRYPTALKRIQLHLFRQYCLTCRLRYI